MTKKLTKKIYKTIKSAGKTIKNNSLMLILLLLVMVMLYSNGKENFDVPLGHTKSRVVMCLADWCGHCKNFKASGEIEKLKNDPQVPVEVNENNEEANKKYKVKGFPAIMVVKENGEPIPYSGERTHASIKDFYMKHVGTESAEPSKPSCDCGHCPSEKQHKSEQTDKLVFLLASWCGYTTKLKDSGAIDELKNDPNISVEVHEDNKEMNKKYNVEGFPTIIKVSSDGTQKLYEGPRTAESLKQFMK